MEDNLDFLYYIENFIIWAALKILVIHNGLGRGEIYKEIFEILAGAKMRKYLCKDCPFQAHPAGITSFALCFVIYFGISYG